MKSFLRNTVGFTLIELLIVVAIIAILAAIAVPNFLEAQTRAKVSRALTDMRTMRTGLESYYVDNNVYPETDKGIVAAAAGQKTFLRLTTPVSYLSSIPASAFVEKYGTGNPADPKVASLLKSYLYVRQRVSAGETALNATAFPQVNAAYADDRFAYIYNSTGGTPFAQRAEGGYVIKSVGPDNLDDRDSSNGRPGWSGANARVYDPTNGTVSFGDVVVFSDGRGSLK